MMVYHFAMAVLVIGVGICCGMLWPQFKTSIYPQYCVATVSNVQLSSFQEIQGMSFIALQAEYLIEKHTRFLEFGVVLTKYSFCYLFRAFSCRYVVS